MELDIVRVLVVDDDATSRLVVQAALDGLGHDCYIASSGERAWTTFRSSRPDVVISDWMMPGLSGLDLCRSIRALPPTSYTYFVMITSRSGLAGLLEGMNAGADDYLLKPLDPDDLQARLVAAARVTSLHRELAQQRVELEEANNELMSIARRDPLTGLRNRRALEEDLELLEARVARYGHRYCMALLDVDLFKAYNDTYGHQSGDDVLQAVGAELTRHARGGDALYRYGGEEFLCIFPEQSIGAGTLAVERMRLDLEQLAIPHADSPFGVVTMSAGLAMMDPHVVRSSTELLKEADEALYRAKEQGRNRVELPASLPA